MSYQAYSQAVFGILVSKEDITIEKKERTCNHNTDVNANFCSVCGEPVYEIEEKMIIEYGDNDNSIGYFISSDNSDEEGVLGFLLAETDSDALGYYAIPKPSQENIKKLKVFLKEHGFKFKNSDLQTIFFTCHSY